MLALAGCRVADRAPSCEREVLRFVAPWGPFAPGDELALPSLPGGRQDSDMLHRGVVLEPSDGHVIALASRGEPALVGAERSAGHVVTCAFPVELLLAAQSDTHGPDDSSWGLYAGLAGLSAGAAAGVDHPSLTTGILSGSRGHTIVVTNHSDETVTASLRLPAGARELAVVAPDGCTPLAGTELLLPPYGALVLTWDRP